MTKRTLGLAGVGVGIVSIVGLLSIPLSAEEMHKGSGEHKEAAPAPASKGHDSMQKMHMMRMGEVLGAIDKATKAVEAGDKTTALAELKKVRQLVVACRQAMSQRLVNAFCPIMGDKLDLNKVTAKRTRMFEGKRVGFCCNNCPAAWDKLSAEEKAKKLAPSLAPKKAMRNSEGSGMKRRETP
ncbi:MAG: hypothetical protein GWP05_00155 [Anaerolineaceae bacterium]|nr:hypothetical protein [Anaerolineaceae bacterium]